ncbi:MAG: hypothetical protein ACRDVL_02955 [Acidimicrobiia bacterium]
MATAPESTGAGTTTTSTSTTVHPSQRCVRITQSSRHIGSGDASTDSLHLSGETFVCADEVVVVSGADIGEVAIAAQLAAAVSGPLLLPHPQLAAEIGRLKPLRVHVVGQVEVVIPPTAEVVRHDLASAARMTMASLAIEQSAQLPEAPHAAVVVGSVTALMSGDRVAVPAEADELATTTTSVSAPTGTASVYDPAAVVAGLAVANEAEAAWLVDASDPISILLTAAYAEQVGAALVAVTPGDLLAHPEVSVALAGKMPDSIRAVGGLPEPDPWQLAVLLNGVQVPGGGFRVFPADQKRRFVAFYGHPETAALGALGEQGPEETLQRMQPFLDAYAGDGSQVVPAFEMIAAVAAASATEDGDYSFEWPVSTFMPWIETARANGAYVILDFQSGRDDFLTQAQMYQELLELPFVGLALDPEWRLRPDQVHLRQTGSVTAAEANQVIDWVADLVRDRGLPQKMIIIHQFKHSMIQDRDTLKERPEIQLVIQMDGEGGAGGEALKDRTYDALTAGTEDKHWKWGWKNFFDEDEPAPPPPENVMRKDPAPVYVSYQ